VAPACGAVAWGCRARQATQKFLSLVVRQWRAGVVRQGSGRPPGSEPRGLGVIGHGTVQA